MFSATYFTYDGKSSADYGLMIADFNDNVVQETPVFSPSLNTQKTTASHRFYHNGILYESAPQFQFSVICDTPINDVKRREILSWLVGRNQYKQLVIMQSDLQNYYYNCVFTETSIIYVNGLCHGFRLTAIFDSPYARKSPIIYGVSAGTKKTLEIDNISDIVDGYTYPIVTFAGTGVEIINETDDNRTFKFSGLADDEQMIIDNEIRHIVSSKGVPRLDKFIGKKWLRLRRGKNVLHITSPNGVSISCPVYVTLGF